MENKNKIINHHAGVVLPYVWRKEGLFFFLERKDPKYKEPYFNGALNFFGGNWRPEDGGPYETMTREVLEETGNIYDPQEALSGLIGEKVSDESAPIQPFDLDDVEARLDGSRALQEFRELGKILHLGSCRRDYVATVHPPILKSDLTYAISVFLNPLLEENAGKIERVLEATSNQPTLDNRKFGGRTELISLNDIISNGEKFAWGYGHIMNDLLARGALRKECTNMRVLTQPLIDVTPLSESLRDALGYDELRAAGLQYKE